MHVNKLLDMIKDSSVRHEFTVTIDLDPEKTEDHPVMGPHEYLFRPDLLLIHWVREDGSKWVRKDVSLKGSVVTPVGPDNRRRCLYKWWEIDELPVWLSEIVNEFKPKGTES
jgi:hypothetical protein